MKQFGPEVNLGNIPPEEVIPLETLRLGLRGDTLKEILLADERRPRRLVFLYTSLHQPQTAELVAQ